MGLWIYLVSQSLRHGESELNKSSLGQSFDL